MARRDTVTQKFNSIEDRAATVADRNGKLHRSCRGELFELFQITQRSPMILHSDDFALSCSIHLRRNEWAC